MVLYSEFFGPGINRTSDYVDVVILSRTVYRPRVIYKKFICLLNFGTLRPLTLGSVSRKFFIRNYSIIHLLTKLIFT